MGQFRHEKHIEKLKDEIQGFMLKFFKDSGYCCVKHSILVSRYYQRAQRHMPGGLRALLEEMAEEETVKQYIYSNGQEFWLYLRDEDAEIVLDAIGPEAHISQYKDRLKMLRDPSKVREEYVNLQAELNEFTGKSQD